jgi:hypothetical protein
MPEDFVPDTHIFQVSTETPASEDIAPPLEAEPLFETDAIEDALLDPLDDDQENMSEETESEKKDPDSPQQMTLF